MSYKSFLFTAQDMLDTKLNKSRNNNCQGDSPLSEAKLIFKHIDETPTINEIIRQRLLGTGLELGEHGDTARLRVLISMLRQIDSTWKVRPSQIAVNLPRRAKTIEGMKLLGSNEH